MMQCFYDYTVIHYHLLTIEPNERNAVKITMWLEKFLFLLDSVSDAPRVAIPQ